MKTVIYSTVDDLYSEKWDGVDWGVDPVFEFETGLDAVKILGHLGDDLTSAQTQVFHILRYIEAAAKAARQGTGLNMPFTPQEIADTTRIARDAIDAMLGETDTDTATAIDPTTL